MMPISNRCPVLKVTVVFRGQWNYQPQVAEFVMYDIIFIIYFI